jgi:hypothetical protein
MLHFRDLQEALRQLLWDRIGSGELTGMSLAQKTGFRQAHISNFLNRKRGLSLEGMDRVLRVEEISVLDLVPPAEINARASIPPPPEDEYANILLVDPQHAGQAQIHARDVLEVLKFKQSFLRRMREDAQGQRANWLRFVMMKPSRSCCESMWPRLAPGCTVLIDRHYNALAPYHRGEQTMYAVQNGNEAIVRYVTVSETTLVLRPESQSAQVRLLRVPVNGTPCELIVGRVAYVSMET